MGQTNLEGFNGWGNWRKSHAEHLYTERPVVAGHKPHELLVVFVFTNLDSDCLGALTSADFITWIKVKTRQLLSVPLSSSASP